MRKKPYLLFLIFSFVLFTSNNTLSVPGNINAGIFTATPSEPMPGETVIITYDASGGPLNGMSDIRMIWYMEVERTKNNVGGIPPSQSMWPANTTAPSQGTNWLWVETALTETTSNNWETSIVWDDIVDALVITFKSGSTTDNNDGSKWRIESALKNKRIGAINAAFSCPLFAIPGETTHLYLEAPAGASSWDVQIEGKNNPTISLNPTASYDSLSGIWDLAVTVPSSLPSMLYDLRYSATIDGSTRFRLENHALRVIDNYKADYNFVILSDPQHLRDGSYSVNKDATTGDGNLTDILTEVNHINPEFVIILGDITEWTDEVAMHKAKQWYTENLNVPLFLVPGNHDEFELTGAPGSGEYGSGLGVYLQIFGGLPYMKFSYGTHFFVSGYSDDQTMDPTSITAPWYAEPVWDHITESIANPPTGTTLKFFMLHHPLSPGYYGSGESVDMVTELLNMLDVNNVDYFLHGHLHSDAYDVLDGTTHIGTDNCIGTPETTGLRIVEMSGDTMTRFSYGSPDISAYDAPSYPVHLINTTFESANDGSQNSNIAYLYNGYNISLPNAKVTFAVVPPGEFMRYTSTEGTVLDTWTNNGVYYVEVGAPISTETNLTLSIEQEAYTPPTTTTTTTIPTSSSETTTTTSTTSTGSLWLVLGSFASLVIVRNKSKR